MVKKHNMGQLDSIHVSGGGVTVAPDSHLNISGSENFFKDYMLRFQCIQNVIVHIMLE